MASRMKTNKMPSMVQNQNATPMKSCLKFDIRQIFDRMNYEPALKESPRQ